MTEGHKDEAREPCWFESGWVQAGVALLLTLLSIPVALHALRAAEDHEFATAIAENPHDGQVGLSAWMAGLTAGGVTFIAVFMGSLFVMRVITAAYKHRAGRKLLP